MILAHGAGNDMRSAFLSTMHVGLAREGFVRARIDGELVELAANADVGNSQYNSSYNGQRFYGTLVHDGRVYDHIQFNNRGEASTYVSGKNKWRFHFNPTRELSARDNWGRKFDVPWRKLNLGACIQQGDFNHRGEQGMFESLGFRFFNLAGVESPHTIFATFRVIDDVREADPTSQYEGDFWGVYLGIEQEDGRFLEEHELPDGNLYKMEAGTGELNNLGPLGPTDKSDLNDFLSNYSGADDAWWRSNLDTDRYYSYQIIVQAIHHYDICYDKNYFYYRHPSTRLWQVVPWDLDLTWAENMYDSECGGVDRIKQRLIPTPSLRPQIYLEWKNRIREIRDLLVAEFAAALEDLDVLAHAQVLDGDGTPIPGLYAAGTDMASIMGGHYPAGGINLGPAMTFGYIAGLHAAEQEAAPLIDAPEHATDA